MSGSRLLCAVERCDKSPDLHTDERLSRGHYHELRHELAAYLEHGDYPMDISLVWSAVNHLSVHVSRHTGGTSGR